MCNASPLFAMILSAPALLAGLVIGAAMTLLGLWLCFAFWSHSHLRAERADNAEGGANA